MSNRARAAEVQCQGHRRRTRADRWRTGARRWRRAIAASMTHCGRDWAKAETGGLGH
jgi:hypothetical protein